MVGLHRVEGRRGQLGDGQRHAEALHDQQCVLAACKSLKGATMPNGQKYEDWLGTLGGQDWFRKYTKNLAADKKSKGINETWKRTTEGKQ